MALEKSVVYYVVSGDMNSRRFLLTSVTFAGFHFLRKAFSSLIHRGHFCLMVSSEPSGAYLEPACALFRLFFAYGL